MRDVLRQVLESGHFAVELDGRFAGLHRVAATVDGLFAEQLGAENDSLLKVNLETAGLRYKLTETVVPLTRHGQ